MGIGNTHEITEKLVNSIYTKSKGIPATIMQMAHQALDKEAFDIGKQDIQKKSNTFGATSTALDINSIWQRHWIKIMCCTMLLFTFE